MLVVVMLALVFVGLSFVIRNPSSQDFQSIVFPNHPSRDFWRAKNQIDARDAREEAAAHVAVRRYGTNVLPELLTLLVSQDSRFQEELGRTPLLGAYIRTETDKHIFAMYGFEALGGMAEPAIPALACLLTNPATSDNAAMCLVYIGGGVITCPRRCDNEWESKSEDCRRDLLGFVRLQ